LLALLFATSAELGAGQAGAVEIDAAELPTRLMAVIEFAAFRQTAVLELASAVAFVAQSAPASMFLDQSILQIVFTGERSMAVVDVNEAIKRVVAIVNLLTIG